MDHFTGIDLHGGNNVIGIIDEDNKRISKKKLKNDLRRGFNPLVPFCQLTENLCL